MPFTWAANITAKLFGLSLAPLLLLKLPFSFALQVPRPTGMIKRETPPPGFPFLDSPTHRCVLLLSRAMPEGASLPRPSDTGLPPWGLVVFPPVRKVAPSTKLLVSSGAWVQAPRIPHRAGRIFLLSSASQTPSLPCSVSACAGDRPVYHLCSQRKMQDGCGPADQFHAPARPALLSAGPTRPFVTCHPGAGDTTSEVRTILQPSSAPFRCNRARDARAKHTRPLSSLAALPSP